MQVVVHSVLTVAEFVHILHCVRRVIKSDQKCRRTTLEHVFIMASQKGAASTAAAVDAPIAELEAVMKRLQLASVNETKDEHIPEGLLQTLCKTYPITAFSGMTIDEAMSELKQANAPILIFVNTNSQRQRFARAATRELGAIDDELTPHWRVVVGATYSGRGCVPCTVCIWDIENTPRRLFVECIRRIIKTYGPAVCIFSKCKK